mgnify:CR=1 FL=1
MAEVESWHGERLTLCFELLDAVTHQLSSVALLAMAHNSAPDQTLSTIAHLTDDALSDLRRLVRVIARPSPEGERLMGMDVLTLPQPPTAVVEAVRSDLVVAGLNAVTTVTPEADTVSPVLAATLARLAETVSKRMSRLASAGSWCSIDIGLDAESVTFAASFVPTHVGEPDKRLESLENRILLLGGALRILTFHGRWTVVAQLPLC